MTASLLRNTDRRSRTFTDPPYESGALPLSYVGVSRAAAEQGSPDCSATLFARIHL